MAEIFTDVGIKERKALKFFARSSGKINPKALIRGTILLMTSVTT